MRERQALIDEDLATIEIKQVFRYTQQRLVPNQHGLELGDRFTDDEKEVIEEVLSFLKPMTAKEVSDMSHEELGWILARDGEMIPYETAWLAPISDMDAWMMADSNATSMKVQIS